MDIRPKFTIWLNQQMRLVNLLGGHDGVTSNGDPISKKIRIDLAEDHVENTFLVWDFYPFESSRTNDGIMSKHCGDIVFYVISSRDTKDGDMTVVAKNLKDNIDIAEEIERIMSKTSNINIDGIKFICSEQRTAIEFYNDRKQKDVVRTIRFKVCYQV